ncbi:MAG TPA: hypothetical protein VGO73_00355 [Pyrinomonadaceae bacterium]|jgi:predicted small secreted protein|nr:hypothetical protein [Pyrinomonadaceae bacterium]
MRFLLLPILFVLAVGLVAGCATSQGGGLSKKDLSSQAAGDPNSNSASTLIAAARNSFPVVHVFVALCDNVNQGIVPVSASLGNGDNPATNLYWGAAFGVKTFFGKSKDWELISTVENPRAAVLERRVFKHRQRDLFIVADAYRGKEIAQATWDFLQAAAGRPGEIVKLASGAKTMEFNTDGSAELVAYVGHNGLMDFALHSMPQARDQQHRQAIILACMSKKYFATPLKSTGAEPLLWTTNLMAPEAYVLSAAIDGWMKKESDEAVRLRAAKAYNSYQNCGVKSANNLFATGW